MPPQGWELRSVPGAFLAGDGNTCPQPTPVSCEKQRGCTGVAVSFALVMVFGGRQKRGRCYFEAVPPSVALRKAEQLSGGISLFHMAAPCKYNTVNKDLHGN